MLFLHIALDNSTIVTLKVSLLTPPPKKNCHFRKGSIPRDKFTRQPSVERKRNLSNNVIVRDDEDFTAISEIFSFSKTSCWNRLRSLWWFFKIKIVDTVVSGMALSTLWLDWLEIPNWMSSWEQEREKERIIKNSSWMMSNDEISDN